MLQNREMLVTNPIMLLTALILFCFSSPFFPCIPLDLVVVFKMPAATSVNFSIINLSKRLLA
jgi:hypothetical protein